MRRPGRRPERIYAFIDSQNLNVSVQRNGWKMDWKRLRQFLGERYGATEVFMFIGYVPEYESIYEQMHDAGYKVVLKQTYDMTRVRPEASEPIRQAQGKPRTDNNDQKKEKEEERHIKGNVDADLVLWAMKELKNYDKAILVSGDGDFYSLVEYLQAEGKLAKILTPGGHYSNLYNRFEQYIDRLDNYKKELAYFDHKRRGSRPRNQSSPLQ